MPSLLRPAAAAVVATHQVAAVAAGPLLRGSIEYDSQSAADKLAYLCEPCAGALCFCRAHLLGAECAPADTVVCPPTLSPHAPATGKEITAETTSHPWPSLLALGHIYIESMSPTVEHVSDTFPSGRSKLIHSVGAIAQCKFEYNGNGNYTGLFRQADFGLCRYSSALEPDTSDTSDPEDSNFIPALAYKFLRDGVPSGNFMSMHLLSAQDSWNPFAYPLSNHLSRKNLDIKTSLLGHKFDSVSDWAFFLGLSDFAKYRQDGTAEPRPNFPYQLIFQPSSQVSNLFPDTYDQYFTDQLSTLPAGTTLYSILAKESPGAHPVVIGSIVLQTPFTTSDYGDNTLFLKHQIFEQDLAYHKDDWLEVCPTADACPVCPVEASCWD